MIGIYASLKKLSREEGLQVNDENMRQEICQANGGGKKKVFFDWRQNNIYDRIKCFPSLSLLEGLSFFS